MRACVPLCGRGFTTCILDAQKICVCVTVNAFVLLPDQRLLCCVPVRLLALMCASVDACSFDKRIFLSMEATCWSSSLRGRALILVVRVSCVWDTWFSKQFRNTVEGILDCMKLCVH